MITSLSIRNFKGFQEQTVPIRPITLLTGLNGSGKSSLVQTFLLLRQAFEAGGFPTGDFPLNGNYLHLGTAEDVWNESSPDEDIEIALDTNSGPRKWILHLAGATDRIARAEIPGGLDVETGLFGGGFTFLAADRISPQIYYGVSEAESIGGRSLGIHGEWTPNFLAINGSQEIAIPACGHPNARSLQLAHQVEAWMGEVSPGVQIHLDTQGKLDLVGMTYSFVARRDVSRRFRPTNVGFGLTYALPVITAVLASKPGDFLILDSPEAHLHPRGQTKLAELLAKSAQSGVQVIVESHSDHVLNGLRVAIYESVIEAKDVGVLYFRWDRKSDQVATTVQEIQIDSNGRIAEWPDGFFDEFDKSLSALLRPRE